MTERQDQIDRWLNAAMVEYGAAPLPQGFEQRTVMRLRERKRKPTLAWSMAFSFAVAILLASVFAVRSIQPDIAAPPSLHANIQVRNIRRVAVETPPTHHPPSMRMATHWDATRGVPIVASSLTPQEQAVLHVVRNSGARQLALLTITRGDLTKETHPLQIQELDIPPLVKQEGQEQ